MDCCGAKEELDPVLNVLKEQAENVRVLAGDDEPG